MLVATWVLAIATAILALSGPVALFQWRSNQKLGRERHQQEHEDALKNSILRSAEESAKDKYVPRTWGGGVLVACLLGLLVWSVRSESRLTVNCYISSSSASTGFQYCSSTRSASYWTANSLACFRRTSASPLIFSAYAAS